MAHQTRISDEAVKKATGKTWKEWLLLLDKAGARDMTHRQIVAETAKQPGVSEWWTQMVAVEYEHRRRKRKVGQTADEGYQIGVQKTIPLGQEKMWELITKPDGRKIWLGDIPRMRWEAGEEFETKSGTKGQVRTIDEGNRIRMTWQPKGRKKPAVLQVTIYSPRNQRLSTNLSFHQEKLNSAAEREKMRKHWRGVLTKLEKLAG